MNRADYLELLTQTYFNTFDECFDDTDFLDFSFEHRKKQFVKQIERKQNIIEKNLGISLDDFIDESNFAIKFLEGQIASNIYEEMKKSSESELNDIENNEAVIYVPLQKVNSSLTGILCQKDVHYIKKSFDCFVSEPQQVKTIKHNEAYKTQNLFKVGLLFASGKMNEYFTITSQGKTVIKKGFSAPSISKDLGNEAYNKLILATINNYKKDNPNGNKNIFNNLDMMTKIIEHCKAKKIEVDPYFESRLPIE